MKALYLPIVIIPLLASCATKPEDPLAEMEAASWKEFSKYVKLSQSEYPQSMVLYEGLPHQMWESEILEVEKEDNKIMEIGEYPFYDDPQTIEGPQTTEILSVLLDAELFVPYGGMKLCGGYHPDYDLLVDLAASTYHIQVCFGCHEMKLIGENSTLIVDMKHGTMDKVRPLLVAYHKHRPESEFFIANKAVDTTAFSPPH